MRELPPFDKLIEDEQDRQAAAARLAEQNLQDQIQAKIRTDREATSIQNDLWSAQTQVTREAREVAARLVDKGIGFDKSVRLGVFKKEQVWNLASYYIKTGGASQPSRGNPYPSDGVNEELFLGRYGGLIIKPTFGPGLGEVSASVRLERKNLGAYVMTSVPHIVEMGAFNGHPDPYDSLDVIRRGLARLAAREE